MAKRKPSSSIESKPARRRSPKSKLGHVPVLRKPLDSIRPSPENDQLYRPVRTDDPEIIALAESIEKQGVLDPIVITLDGFILSGHRRYAAARLAGLKTIPCRVERIRRLGNRTKFLVRLREFNRQRHKSRAEQLREELVTTDPNEAYASLVNYRHQQAQISCAAMRITGRKERCQITAAKAPMLAAVRRVLEDLRRFWPVSDRQIHYALLNDPPLRHAAKPDSIYANTPQSYKSLVELLTRARLAGIIAMEAIADETRPVMIWDVHAESRSFIRRELNGFLKGYYRDLLQSQPNHIEIVGEKNTVAPILRPVAARFRIPMTTGRGYCSLPPRAKIAERYRDSGKEQLVLLVVSDFDPDGEEIAMSLARSLRDDFDIDDIHPIKVALTAEQVEEYRLPPVMKAKTTSVHHAKFTDRYGDDVWELEALPPAELQRILTCAIDSVLHIEAFNAEIDEEHKDAAFLQAVRNQVNETLRDLELDAEDDDNIPGGES